MFKYVTTTLINGATYVNGEPSWFLNNKGTLSASDTTNTDFNGAKSGIDLTEVALTINRGGKFKKENVVRVSRASYKAAAKGTAVIDTSKISYSDGTTTVTGLKAGESYKMFLYIGSNGNANPLYANDYKYKGRPFGFEFTVKSAATAGADIATAAKKWLTLLWDNGPIVKFSGSGTSVTITATDEYQTFDKIQILRYDSTELVYAFDGAFVPIADSADAVYTAATKNYKDAAGIFVITQGTPGFGTYELIIKDLRLPTNVNTNLYRVETDEVPNIGGKYWQYVIEMCTERPEMQGTSVLGQYNKSITQHVVFVEDGQKSAFETALATVSGTLTNSSNGSYAEWKASTLSDVASDVATLKAGA